MHIIQLCLFFTCHAYLCISLAQLQCITWWAAPSHVLPLVITYSYDIYVFFPCKVKDLMSRKLIWHCSLDCSNVKDWTNLTVEFCSLSQPSLLLKDELSFRSKCVLWSQVGGWKEDCTRFLHPSFLEAAGLCNLRTNRHSRWRERYIAKHTERRNVD